jgi:hypothetical protein
MMWLRMAMVALRLARPHSLAPWRSPLVRWRLETFGVLDEQGRLLTAGQIDRRVVFRFLRERRPHLLRFLRWAARLGDH